MALGTNATSPLSHDMRSSDEKPLLPSHPRGILGNRYGSIQAVTPPKPLFPYRYRLVILSFFAFFNSYSMRVNFNIALVSIVKLPRGSDGWNSSTDVCPGETPDRNNSRHPRQGEFNWSSDIQSTLLGSYYYGYPILQILGGYLADRFGSKTLIGLSQLIPAVLTLLTPLVTRWNVYALIAVRATMGLCAGPIYPAMYVFWSHWAPKYEQTQIISIAGSGVMVGTVISLAASGILCQSTFLDGWPLAFYTFGGIAVLWSLVWFKFVYDTPTDHPHITQQEREYIAEGSHAGNIEDPYENPPWKKILTSLPFLSIVLVMLTEGLGYYTLLNSTPLYLKQILNFDMTQNGLLSALPYLTSFLPYISLGFLADYLRRNQMLSTGATRKLFTFIGENGMALCMVGLAFVECDRNFAVCLLVLASFMECWIVGGHEVNILDIAPRYAGTLMGIGNTIGSIGGFVSPIIIAKLTRNSASRSAWQEVFYINGAVLAFGALVYTFFSSGKEQEWAKSRSNRGRYFQDEEQ